MFFGLKMEPGCRYEQDVDTAFRITMAILAPEGNSRFEGDIFVKAHLKELGTDIYLCKLEPGRHEQQRIDVKFSPGDFVTFSVQPAISRAIHLSGYYEPDPSNFDGEDFDESDSEDDAGDDSVEEEEMEEEEEKDEEQEEEKKSPAKADNDKKRKAEPKSPAAGANTPQAKKPKATTPTKAEVTTLQGGVKVKDLVEGDGAVAKKGSKLMVRYTGRIFNDNRPGKVFDSNTHGRPFQFKLGGGEVIKGWDIGFENMRVGGKRQLTIPPAMAYGKRGSPPDIPANATLQFDVELVQIK